jgi:hypothetical protein
VFLARHVVAVSIVVVALAVTASVFVFARPHYVPQYQSTTLDIAKRHPRLTVQRVRAAFRAHGIRLDHGGPLLPNESAGAWFVMLAAVPAPVDITHLQVDVFGPRAKVGWTETHPRYEALFGNVAVTYDGSSDDVVARAKAAVADLR